MGKDDRYSVEGTDDGLGSDTGSQAESVDSDDESTPTAERNTAPKGESGSASGTSSPDASSASSPAEIPHRVRHDGPKEGRDAKTVYLSTEDTQQLDEFERLAKSTFDETVYALDVYLAGMRAGLHGSDEDFLDEMREIGYGYFE